MYSEREKVRYVEMMWAEGLTPCAAGRKWGLPARATLRQWEKLAEAGKLPAEMPKSHVAIKHAKHTRYPNKIKDEAVRLYRAGEKPAHIARRLGILKSSIIPGWSRKALKDATMSKTDTKSASTKTDKVGTKVKAMRKSAEEKPSEETEALKAQLNEALLEVAAYKELMRDPKVANPASLSKRQLVGLGEKLRRDYGYSLVQILTFLGISKSTYLYHRAHLNNAYAKKDAFELDVAVASVLIETGATYGYPRIAGALSAKGIRAPERKVRVSMARQGLIAHCSRAEKKWSSYAGEVSDAPNNLLLDKHMRHRFVTEVPNALWLTDITEMRGRDGKIYLSVIVDCFDGKVAAWKVSTSPNAELANSTLLDAVAHLQPGQHPIIHSDRGGHYRWPGWIRICNEAGLVRSMSRKGHSPDNAACEGFFGRAKVELFHSLVRAGATVAELLKAIERYMTWYNQNRLKTFKRNGKKISCETIAGRRRRLGLVA